MKKTIAVMPLKLDNERLPGKNTMLLGGKPLLQYELETLQETALLDSIFVYCSDDSIIPFLPRGVIFARRSSELDLPSSNFTQIFTAFMNEYNADIYVYAHATAPFISTQTMIECIEAVMCGEYDSAFCATVIQDYLWQDGCPLNFDARNIPRSQDLKPIYRETSGIYVFTKQLFVENSRRIGEKPYVKKVGYKEAVDINNLNDFKLAEALLGVDI